jgi:hypothetical protein
MLTAALVMLRSALAVVLLLAQWWQEWIILPMRIIMSCYGCRGSDCSV